jgi:hypothetical protein
MVGEAALLGMAAAILGLGAIFLAWRKTQGRPVIRVIAVSGAVLFALVLNVVVKEITGEMAKQAMRSQGQQASPQGR